TCPETPFGRSRSSPVAKRLLIAIAKGATELRIAPNWHPKAIGRIAVYALECPRTIHLPVARSQSPCRFRSAASASRSATKGFETRKFVASKRLRADGR